jgi:hypothetical protein
MRESSMKICRPGTQQIMPKFILTDVSSDVWAENFEIDPTALGLGQDWPWTVKKERLRGGRRDGVDLIVVDNGLLRFSVVPTRGMGLWKGWFQGNRLGWDSPVTDGPVHPALVNLSGAGGLGWLDGFDELLARCGLENNGAPFEVKTVKPDGNESHTTFGLHGRIANIPASYVAVQVAPEPPHEIAVIGHVDETRLFGLGIRMATRIATVPGSNSLTIRDEFINLKDQPAQMQILYHWNFGPPFLGEGARFVAPIKSVTPRDARAAQAIRNHNSYQGPTPGYTEQVYYYELGAPSEEANKTLAMLRNRDGDRAVVLRFRKDQLPAFTLWKNTAGLRDGYVTGLEPGTNFPNARPFEEARGRTVTLPVGGSYVTETTLEVFAAPDEVAIVQAEIDRLQSKSAIIVSSMPKEPFAPEG